VGSDIVGGKRKAADVLFRVFTFRGDPDGVFMFILFQRQPSAAVAPGDHVSGVIRPQLFK
jgi:hypothetical protein